MARNSCRKRRNAISREGSYPLDRLHHEINLIARYHAEMTGVEHAEPFPVKEVMQVEDVVTPPVRSI